MNTGRTHFKKGMTPWNKGRSMSEETRRKVSLAKKGTPAWNKGLIKPMPTCLDCGKVLGNRRSKKCMQHAQIGVHKGLRNELNPMWKGDHATYEAVHAWVKVRLGKATYCTNNLSHTASRYEWANISGEYKRDINDWHSFCSKCNKNDGIKRHPRFIQGGLIV